MKHTQRIKRRFYVIATEEIAINIFLLLFIFILTWSWIYVLLTC